VRISRLFAPWSKFVPDEFLKRGHDAVDEAALRLSHTLDDRQEEWLRGFADRVRAQWRDVFSPALRSEDVDGIVADVVARVRAKRAGLESVDPVFPGGNEDSDR
jgi:hypothetical protein